MRYVLDLDGTICEELPTFERSLAKVKPGAKKFITDLWEAGHTIIIYTARGWSEARMTELWLDDVEIPYHYLLFGKPIYDVWIDDRAIKFEDWSKINL